MPKRSKKSASFPTTVRTIRLPIDEIMNQALSEIDYHGLRENQVLIGLLREGIFALADYKRDHGENPVLCRLAVQTKDDAWRAMLKERDHRYHRELVSILSRRLTGDHLASAIEESELLLERTIEEGERMRKTAELPPMRWSAWFEEVETVKNVLTAAGIAGGDTPAMAGGQGAA